MSRIQVLPENLCNKIAAGEIVERPSSVVKELIENAIDAGSARITVETEESGRRLIRVTDDGEGMGADDAVRAIERHATSKIRSESDLSDIRTMGFRGEALPSIASVSRMRLVTSEKGALVGIEVRVSPAGQAQTRETAPMSGTLVEAADLFYNTPARKKFLRSNSTELSHIVHAVQQQALAHPWIHFRLTHNGGELLDYPAVRDEMERAAQVIGMAASRGNGPDLIEIRAEAGSMRLLGLVSKPGVFRATREKQEFFLNRRPIKNTTLSHALSEAYGTLLGKGRHPAAFLFLEVNPEEADVNVHPAKREVRFRDAQAIHRFVRNAIRARLIREDGAPGFEERSAGEAAWDGGSGRPSGIVTSDAPGRDAVSSASYSREAMAAYRPLRAVPSANPFPAHSTAAPGPPLFS
ncbi:MAG TPA: DNA mismatch repair endonuclease MutL, partial [Nitrospiria bacterium]